ncbi:unnamed protein product [Prorocentrum cordatum]|uniref:Mei2-like C-terminal RNA recognition motif domain-containing protein n=1 Tax=Prorocentrum cordatum TaxID=2364126 RepID=A0ABN9X1H9_9DINO|nr:unnamed protein product [Polarella glacialis]
MTVWVPTSPDLKKCGRSSGSLSSFTSLSSHFLAQGRLIPYNLLVIRSLEGARGSSPLAASAHTNQNSSSAAKPGLRRPSSDSAPQMASAIASAFSVDERPFSTPGHGAGLGAQVGGGLRRAQSAPVLSRGPAVACRTGCPALAWADMLELDAPAPLSDDSSTASSEDVLSASLALLDEGGASPAGSRGLSPAAACTPLGLLFQVPYTLPLKAPAASDRAVGCTRTSLSAKARPFVAAGVTAAETLLQRSPCTWAVGRDGEWPLKVRPKNDACNAPVTRTTVMMRNVPYMWTREKLLALLDSKGFAKKYDFVYVPIDFETTHTRGYCFVNLTSPSHVEPFFETFGGFCDWQCEACRKECQVCWSETQTLHSNILRYKDSNVMSPSVPDAYKPIILKDGVRIPFPQPARECREFGKSSGTIKGLRMTTRTAFSAARGRCM